MLMIAEDIGPYMTTSKRKILWAFPFALLIWLCGGMFLDKRGGKYAGMSITNEAKKRMKNGQQVSIFD